VPRRTGGGSTVVLTARSQESSLPQPSPFGSGPRLDLPLHRRSRARRIGSHWRVLILFVLALTALGAGAVAANPDWVSDRFDGLVRRVDRFLAGPVPDRSTRPTVTVTEPPVAEATATPRSTPTVGPSAAASGDPLPTLTAAPDPTPTPLPARVPVDVNLLSNPEAAFTHQATKDWCAVAGVSMVLDIHGKLDATAAFQQELASRVREWESWDDSHNGNWGPAAMALALEAYGVPGYEVRAYESRGFALRDAARQISATGAPVILLTWRGAHTWVMTGFRADADPLTFRDPQLSGAYILDPWYPDVSSIWGPSNPPGFFTTMDELVDNYLRWQRPEGAYPDRDGLFIAVVPTLPLEG
jgi:hypothetical protein